MDASTMSDNPAPQKGTLTRLMDWVSHPFASDMSAGRWLLFLGLVVVGIVLWTRVMNHITE